MRSGRCTDGSGATSPFDRTCKACSNCYPGEYKTAVCLGTDFYQSFGCALCEPCPEGSYVSKPCDGTAFVGGAPARDCTACRRCQEGEYRVGCSDGQGTGTSSALADDSSCAPCAPCPDGFYIGRQCPGDGSSPTDRTCVRCSPCQPGQYCFGSWACLCFS